MYLLSECEDKSGQLHTLQDKSGPAEDRFVCCFATLSLSRFNDL